MLIRREISELLATLPEPSKEDYIALVMALANAAHCTVKNKNEEHTDENVSWHFTNFVVYGRYALESKATQEDILYTLEAIKVAPAKRSVIKDGNKIYLVRTEEAKED